MALIFFNINLRLVKKRIHVSLPINIDEKTLPFFEPYLSFEIAPFKVKSLENILVTYSGLAIGENGLIKESHHDYQYEKENCLNEASCYYNDAIDNPDENLIILDNENTYLLIHHPWYNYYHWICEAILRLWIVRENKDNLILLLPDYYGKTDFIMGSLEPFNLQNIFYIPSNKSVLIRNLCLPQIKLDNEDNSFLEQISIYSNASYLISIHGSGLTNMLFMKEGSSIFEILKKKTNTLNRPSFVFWYQAEVLGYKYYQQISDPLTDNDDYFLGDFYIDLPLFEKNIINMLFDSKV